MAPPPWHQNTTETPVTYDKRLLGQLADDHHILLGLLADIGKAFAAGDIAHASALLRQFRYRFETHLLIKRSRLHAYLEQAFAHDDTCLALINDVLDELRQMATNMLYFLDKYRRLDTIPALHAGFADDLHAMGALLGQRIKREVSALFPLYLPPVHALSETIAG